jgi:hypothetical protein
MSKIHWSRILNDPAATRLLWDALGHEDLEMLEESCSIMGPVGDNALITFHYEGSQGNPECCGIEKLAGKYLFFGDYCAYEDDAGPFDDFEDAFGCIHDKDTIDVSQVDYVVSSKLPLDQTLEICAQHVAKGRNITINGKTYTLLAGKLAVSPSK